MRRTALVLGATGLVGQLLLRRLIDNRSYARVIVYCRRKLELAHPKLGVQVIDFGALSDAPASGADDVFCCIGTTLKQAGSRAAFFDVDAEYPAVLAEKTRREGAQRFLLISAVGASSRSTSFYLRTKAEAERRVALAAFEATHVFRPSVLLGERAERRVLETLSARLLIAGNWALGGALRRYRGIAAPVVAAAMESAALSPLTGLNIHHYDEMQRLAGSAPDPA